ncbi:src like adaptor 1a [Paramormyrops kingsleyae]|uniref:Src like adaptor n=1 Tax=Paramormyrops kingsleyae TaxID=1676925 RepID=A0A3B3QBB6_9TELE|nr:src-like-adapter [Paramormyrops kingsleyae]
MGNAVRSEATNNAGNSPEQKESEVLIVINDYPSSNISEPIFRTGEKLRLLSEEGCWLKVCSLLTAAENYIPNNYVAKVYHSWLFEGVDRKKSEELLFLPGNRIGSFMIRESAREKGVYCLSVRHRSIIHYRIFRLPNNWYYISPRLTFQCLEDLVTHYSDLADGLCCVLNAPCLAQSHNSVNIASQAPPVVMRRNNNQKNMNSPQLENQSTEDLQDDEDDQMSYGVRDSIASYLSLANSEVPSRKITWTKKRKTMYALPSQNCGQVTEEDRWTPHNEA